MKKTIIMFAITWCFAASMVSAESTLPNPPVNNANVNQALLFTPAQLEQILAPIALYPDTLLTHILIAATYPLEVVAAQRWLSQNSELSKQQIIEQGELQDWDPSVVALLPFKDILTRMSEDLQWTQQLGDAFLDNQQQVLASIQSLRQKADEAGNLEQLANVEVSKQQQNIVIEPTNTQIVYVPYYDTRVVYGIWAWPYYPPVYWHHHRRHYATYYGPIYYTPPVYLTLGWFYGGVYWHSRQVVIHNHHSSYYRHHYKKHYGHKKYAKHHAAKGKGKHHWHHNPKHRKGVAYQNKKTADRYGSNRPTSQYSKRIRNEERDFKAPRHQGKPLPGYSGKGKHAKKATRSAPQSTQLTQRNKQFQQELQRERYRGKATTDKTRLAQQPKATHAQRKAPVQIKGKQQGNSRKNKEALDSRIIRVAKQRQLDKGKKQSTTAKNKPSQASRAQQLQQQLRAGTSTRQTQQSLKLQQRQVSMGNTPQQRPQTKQYGLNKVNKTLAQGGSFNQLPKQNIGKNQSQTLTQRQQVQLPKSNKVQQTRIQTSQPQVKALLPRRQKSQPRVKPRSQPRAKAPQRAASSPKTRPKH